ncbi:MAG TPA: hypothetical protein VK886_05125 [Vicinamibacterales bacterium]|nr:hypothetical protein [Vicinamibacterales bacterium]
MTIVAMWRAIAIVAVAGLSAVCGSSDVGSVTAPASAAPATAIQTQQADAGDMVPFHSEVVWQFEQVPIPEGHCTQAIPGEFSFLWFSRIRGTATTTHLGTGPYEIDLCLYGTLTDPGAPPPNNGIPMGWYAERQVWTAANGDQLRATGGLIGFTAPPGTPGFKFIESVTFLNGGTGRFKYAEGSGQGIVDADALTAVYDGLIRYGRKEK